MHSNDEAQDPISRADEPLYHAKHAARSRLCG
jgi:PleD family two-component response regulator